ncbi:hypothetical protein [Streptomyces sp. Wb2n-11]|uniref:hypothetical protein n=1 Tax=Streptomyces sp. Wb2n-11 TaxID=1030533 RepID=UPI000AC2F1F6|nr:hypothetical protein [Streptomyces sp. Wb2n-11]
MSATVGQRLAALEKRLKDMERASRLSHAALDNTALEVRDDSGSLRAIVGQQDDGTSGVNVVNGPPPPAPTPPTVEPALAALAISWDGTFADAVAAPLDWMRCEVHIGPDADYTPSQDTLRDTIETPQGGTVTVPLPYTEWFVKLRSRTTSGATSAATAAVAATPRKADTEDLTAGLITADLIAVDALTGKAITGGTITGSILRTATSGERVAINESSGNDIKLYDATGVLVATLDGSGLRLVGDNGSSMTLNPDSVYPYLQFSSEDGLSNATIRVAESTPGAANLELTCGAFTSGVYTDMRWRTILGSDYWVAERYTSTPSYKVLGGRVDLRPTHGTFGYMDNTGSTSVISRVVFSPGMGQVEARLRVEAPASDSSALYAQAAAGHTGYLMRLYDANAAAYRFAVDLAGNTDVNGVLNARNIATGTVTITPSAAHQSTSTIVSGLNVAGTTFRGYATANTTVVGVRSPLGGGAAGVTGVAVTSVSSTGLTVWVNRENTTATVVNWMVIGS